MASIVGPYGHIQGENGMLVPWYIMPFDKRGQNKAPRTTAHLLNELATQAYTHVFFFSHGWNNDWSVATGRYKQFATGLVAQRAELNLPLPASYKPVMVGIQWPSTSLVLPWEKGPVIAATQDEASRDVLSDDTNHSIDLIAEELAQADLPRFYELVNAEGLERGESLELANLLIGISGQDEEPSANPSPAELAESWWQSEAMLSPVDSHAGGDSDFGTVSGGGAPEVAGLLSKLDPRHALRMLTVWKMKDRAGVVGAAGVSQLLKEILARSNAAVHLIGHSYGCKVVLSALVGSDLPRPVESALLLQPAFSQRAFAADATGNGQEGGYRRTFAQIRQPIISTYSRHDFALREAFHLAVRRRSDIGELAAAANESPSRFAALGGYGPWGLDNSELVSVSSKDPGQAYSELQAEGVQIIGLDSSVHIDGHGDIANAGTYWALHEQLRVHMLS